MRCRKCGENAVIYISQHNIALCEQHFDDFFLDRVRKAIGKYRLFPKNARILVAVSGGKDSLAIWDVLNRLGYRADGLHIDLGIGEYSMKSRNTTESFASEKGYKLIVVDVRDYLEGFTVPLAAKKLRRATCSLCGLVKRYIMNRVGLEEGYDVLVTGHNMDDEAATLLGNIINWQVGYLTRQKPLLEKRHEKFIPKAKPLIYLTEREVAAYAIMRGINYVEEECPNAHGATSLEYKALLNELERKHPGTKHRFYHTFLGLNLSFDGVDTSRDVKLNSCEICGYPTTERVCAMCRVRERLSRLRGE